MPWVLVAGATVVVQSGDMGRTGGSWGAPGPDTEPSLAKNPKSAPLRQFAVVQGPLPAGKSGGAGVPSK